MDAPSCAEPSKTRYTEIIREPNGSPNTLSRKVERRLDTRRT
jgi:hypothetical protein